MHEKPAYESLKSYFAYAEEANYNGPELNYRAESIYQNAAKAIDANNIRATYDSLRALRVENNIGGATFDMAALQWHYQTNSYRIPTPEELNAAYEALMQEPYIVRAAEEQINHSETILEHLLRRGLEINAENYQSVRDDFSFMQREDGNYNTSFMLDQCQVYFAALIKICLLHGWEITDENLATIHEQLNLEIHELPRSERRYETWSNYADAVNPDLSFVDRAMETVLENKQPYFFVLSDQSHFVTLCLMPSPEPNGVSVLYLNSVTKENTVSQESLEALQEAQREGDMELYQVLALTMEEPVPSHADLGRNTAQLICNHIKDGGYTLITDELDEEKGRDFIDLSQHIQYSECCGMAAATFVAHLSAIAGRSDFAEIVIPKERLQFLRDKMTKAYDLAGVINEALEEDDDLYTTKYIQILRQVFYYENFGQAIMACKAHAKEEIPIQNINIAPDIVEDELMMSTRTWNLDAQNPRTTEDLKGSIFFNLSESDTLDMSEWLEQEERERKIRKENAQKDAELAAKLQDEELRQQAEELVKSTPVEAQKSETTVKGEDNQPIIPNPPNASGAWSLTAAKEYWQSYSTLQQGLIVITGAALVLCSVAYMKPEVIRAVYQYCLSKISDITLQ